MDTLDALTKVNDSFIDGINILDISLSEITGECSPQIQEIVKLRKTGNVTKEALNRTIMCLNDAGCLLILAFIASNLAYHNCSIKAYKKAISIYDKNENVLGLALSQSKLCMLYSDIGYWDEACKYGQESHRNYEKLGDNWIGDADLDMHWGNILTKLGKWKDAISILQQSHEKFKKRGDNIGVAKTCNSLGALFFKIGDWKKAIENFQKSLKIFEEFENYVGTSMVYNNLVLHKLILAER